MASLKFRYNGKYDKIPNYVVTSRGKVLKLLDDNSYSNYFPEENINRNSVIVSLENLGWLEKKPLTNYHISWNGSIYNEQVYEKRWRDFFFWEPYNSKQVDTAAELCYHLITEIRIKKNCVGHNTKIDGIQGFEGIVSRSNFNSKYTDLNPSFNFETFNKLLEHGQFT